MKKIIFYILIFILADHSGNLLSGRKRDRKKEKRRSCPLTKSNSRLKVSPQSSPETDLRHVLKRQLTKTMSQESLISPRSTIKEAIIKESEKIKEEEEKVKKKDRELEKEHEEYEKTFKKRKNELEAKKNKLQYLKLKTLLAQNNSKKFEEKAKKNSELMKKNNFALFETASKLCPDVCPFIKSYSSYLPELSQTSFEKKDPETFFQALNLTGIWPRDNNLIYKNLISTERTDHQFFLIATLYRSGFDLSQLKDPHTKKSIVIPLLKKDPLTACFIFNTLPKKNRDVLGTINGPDLEDIALKEALPDILEWLYKYKHANPIPNITLENLRAHKSEYSEKNCKQEQFTKCIEIIKKYLKQKN